MYKASDKHRYDSILREEISKIVRPYRYQESPYAVSAGIEIEAYNVTDCIL